MTTRNAIIYGGGGSIGAAVAAAFVRDGMRVHLVGRTGATLEGAAAKLGAMAEVAELDGVDEAAVDDHAARVAADFGSIDVSFNLISRGDVQGVPLVHMSTDDVLRATENGLRSNLITARAAARQMTAQGSGVLLHLNSASGAGAAPGMGSTGPADAAIESLYRYLSVELRPSGIRVCGIWTAGVAESLTQEKIASVAGDNGPTPEQAIAMLSGMAALRRTPRLSDVAETAAFLASDRASGITGAMTNVTCGLVLR